MSFFFFSAVTKTEDGGVAFRFASAIPQCAFEISSLFQPMEGNAAAFKKKKSTKKYGFCVLAKSHSLCRLNVAFVLFINHHSAFSGVGVLCLFVLFLFSCIVLARDHTRCSERCTDDSHTRSLPNASSRDC